MKEMNRQPGVFCLNRGWKFSEQDYPVLPKGKSHEEVYGYSKGGAALGPASKAFDDSGWESVELPHDWVTAKDFTKEGSPNQGYKERGTAWYRICFGLSEEDRGRQLLLEFEGMSCDAQIYVNGAVLKRSFSGYNSFTVDMTDMAEFGVVPNVLAVRIDASSWEGWWYEGAGIYRNVWLIKKSPVHIAADGVYIRPSRQEDDSWSLELEVELENSFETGQNAAVRAELYDADGESVGAAQTEAFDAGFGRTKAGLRLTGLAPRLWSTENPYLYEVRVGVSADGEETDFLWQRTGFRTIRLDAETGFYLNGGRIKLKGFCNHQDHPGVGVAAPYAIKEYRIRRLQELGANAYRCAHNPDPEILDICDRLGMLVMEENRTFSSSRENLEQMRGIVKRARNHPCVILYSVFNEEPLQGTGKGRRMAGRLRAAVRELDDTRPVLGAFNGGYMEEDGAATILDAVGINYNPHRYDEFHAKFPHIPLLGTETASAFTVRGEYETDQEKHLIDSYDTECAPWGNTVREAWSYVLERDFVAGAFVWTGFDYRGEPTPFEWPSVATFFGTYDSCGFEKEACYFYRAFWRPEPMVHLAAPWSRSGKGEDVKIMIISNCEEVILYQGDRLLLRERNDPFHPPVTHTAFDGEELRAVGLIAGEPVAEHCLKPKGRERRLVLTASREGLLTGGYDAAAVNVELLDENGTLIEDEDDLVTFETVSGRILGVGNGDPNSHEPDKEPYRRLYHGRAQAVVGADDTGDVRIRAFGAGKSCELVLPLIRKESIPYVRPVEEQVIGGFKLFHKILWEKPSGEVNTLSNDMNSFEPVSYGRAGQAELDHKPGAYGLYRTRLDAGEREEGRYLYFEDVIGDVWLYLNGREIGSRLGEVRGRFVADLPEEAEGGQQLYMVIQNTDREFEHAGICFPAVMRKRGHNGQE